MILTSTVIALGSVVACAQSPAEVVRATSTVWQRGEAGYHTFRIPSVIALPSGDVLAFAEGRKNGSSDTGDIDLVMKRSQDGGATWSESRVLWDDGDHVCGNPCVVRDATTGVLHLLSTRNLGQDHESEIIRGTSEGTRTVWTLTSADDGVTWTKPREITKTAKQSDWTWYATGPGIGIQLEEGDAKGRLIIPCDHIERDTKGYYSHVIYSDDHGATWQIGGRSTRDQLNECQIAELGPGELIMNMRNYDRAKKTRAVMRSTDGGLTFGEVDWDEGLPDPICQAGLIAGPIRSADDGPRRLYFSNCASPAKRERMTIRVSEDGGRSWTVLKELHAGPSAYSCLVLLPDGEARRRERQLGCLYECGAKSPYERIEFATVVMKR